MYTILDLKRNHIREQTPPFFQKKVITSQTVNTGKKKKSDLAIHQTAITIP